MTEETPKVSIWLRARVAVVPLVMAGLFAWWYLGKMWGSHATIGATLVVVFVHVVAFAIPLALVYHFATNLPPVGEVLRGREKFRRIALWYCGMAACGAAGYLGCSGMYSQWWSPFPWLSLAPISILEMRFLLGPAHFFWAYAMLAYICMDGPLLRARHITRLPPQATLILILYSLSSIAWFIIGFIQANRDWSDPMRVVLLVANIAAIAGLWWGWLKLRRNCNATRVIAWNTALICWLFWFAHPIILFKTIPPYLLSFPSQIKP